MKRKCFHCGSNEFRRINRQGFIERSVLPLIGLFPWECVLCRHRRFFFDEGKGTYVRRRRSAPIETAGPPDI